jgi:transposase-like protein
MERKKYTAEFKREAVKLARQDGVSRAKVAQELGLNVTMQVWAASRTGDVRRKRMHLIEIKQ